MIINSYTDDDDDDDDDDEMILRLKHTVSGDDGDNKGYKYIYIMILHD